MELKITTEMREGYFYVAVAGDFELQRAKDLFVEAMAAAAESGQCKILVDYLEMEGSPSTTADFEYASFVAEHLREACHRTGDSIPRLAYVGRNPNPSFGENVAVNRGAVGRSTTDFDEALAWLLEAEPAPEPSG